MGRHSEVKSGASRLVGGQPQTPTMTFDDRAADRPAHAQATWLRRIECIKYELDILCGQTGPRVADRDDDSVRLGCARRNEQLSRAVRDCVHCLDGIDDEIEHDLLQLDPIPFDEWQAVREACLYGDLTLHRFAVGKLDHFEYHPVDL